MKAIFFTEYGPANVLRMEDVPKPIPKEDEVLIKIHAAEATKSDCEMRKMKFALPWLSFPMRLLFGIRKPKRNILGGYFAGEVEQVGKAVSKFKPGDQVFGCAQLLFGGYGQYACFPANYSLVSKPDNISFEEAAGVPLGGLNALHFLRLANVKPGESVLVNGAGGSIGAFGVQIAKDMGAKVTGVDCAAKEELVCKLGADSFLDYQKTDFASSEEKYDVIFDMVAGNSYSKCIQSLKANGRYVMGNPSILGMLRGGFSSWFSDKRVIHAFANETPEELQTLANMLADRRIISPVYKVLPFAEVAEAHRLVETEERIGTVILSWDVNGQPSDSKEDKA